MEKQLSRQPMSDASVGLLVLLGALAVAAWSQLATFVDPFVISEDARQHIYWMQRFRNPEIFSNDLLARYSEHYQPWGYVVFYRAMSTVVDPLVLSRMLPVLLSAATALVLFRLVSGLSDRFGGVLAAACFVATPEYMSRMSGAFPRAFAYLLLATFLWLLLERHYRALAALLILESLLYPVSFVVSAGTLALGLVAAPSGKPRLRLPTREEWVCVVAVAVGSVVLAAQFATVHDPEIGATVTRAAMEGEPEYGRLGRVEVIPGRSLAGVVARNAVRGVLPHWRPGLRGGGWIKLLVIAALLAFLAVRVARRRREYPRALLDFPMASILGFLLAELVLMKLFLPARYVEAAFKLSVLIACTTASSDLAKVVLARSHAGARGLRALLLLLPVMALPAMQGRGLYDRGEVRELAGFIATLPADTLIAAHPLVADDIPYFAARSVFVNRELSHPFYGAYWKTVKARTHALFAAHYARDWREVDTFCAAHGIEVFIGDRRHFGAEYLDGDRLYFEPFGSELRALTRASRNFALLEVSASERIFDSENYFVLRCGGRS